MKAYYKTKFCFSSVFLIIILLLNSPFGLAQSYYKLDFKREAVIFGTGLVLGVSSFPINNNIHILTIDEINNLNRDNINSFDRRATFNYSTTEGKYSDVLLAMSMISPALLALSNDVRNDFAPVVTMYIETLMFSALIPHITKGITKRIRPFVYNDNVPLSEKQVKEAKRSFFSGHTTLSFAMAVFLSTVYSNYYPNSSWKPYVWAGSLALATTVGILRYSSGSHFPTDIITGALVGSAIGYLIPFTHKTNKSNLNVSFNINGRSSIVNFHYEF